MASVHHLAATRHEKAIKGQGANSSPTPEGGDLLTIMQVLQELDIPRRTWQRWRELGTGPKCIRLPNRELRVRRAVLSDWLMSMEEVA